jgi:hypothetical protein
MVGKQLATAPPNDGLRSEIRSLAGELRRLQG